MFFFQFSTFLLFSRWKFLLKKWWAKMRLKDCIKSEQELYRDDLEHVVLERPRFFDTEKSSDYLMFFGQDQLGNSLLARLCRGRGRETEAWIVLRLQDGRTFTLADHPDTLIFNVKEDRFDAAGLAMQTMIPFVSTRIIFNGLLRPSIRKRWQNNLKEEELVQVKFHFIFKAKAHPLYWPYDWNMDLMATALASVPWISINYLGMLLSEPNSRGYDQYGAMKGEIFISGESLEKKTASAEEKLEINLPGLKMRRWGPLQSTHLTQIAHLIGVCADGTVFIVGAFALKEGLKHAQFGSVIRPNGVSETISWTDLNLDDLSSASATATNSFIVQFQGTTEMFKVELRLHRATAVPLFRGRPIHWVVDCISVGLNVNNEGKSLTGRGILIVGKLQNSPGYGPTNSEPVYKTLNYYNLPPNPERFVHLFYEEAARSILISGGKGASLATLAIVALSSDISFNVEQFSVDRMFPRQLQLNLARTISPPEMSIPEGFIISSSALRKTIQMNVTLEGNIERMKTLVAEGKDFRSQCAEIVEQIQRMGMDTDISREILISYRTLKESSIADKKNSKAFSVAVRSSSTTEDTVEVSGAGQNETILGVNTENDLLNAVTKCWASLYSSKSVEYRRQTVQPIDTDMAVIVQRMIQMECAGVLFTNNPVNENPKQCLIKANFGLGLGGLIVSGEVEPDEFVVQRSYNDSRLTVLSRRRGTKKIILHLGKKGNLERKTNKKKGFCVSEESILELTRIGIVLEMLFGHPVDIEWGIKGGKIFILQCRPITMENRFSDWELIHEFDVAVMTEEDLWTTGNVQEAFPNAVTPLTMSFLIATADNMMKKLVKKGVRRTESAQIAEFFLCFNYHLFLDVFKFLLRHIRTKLTMDDIVMGYALVGKDYITPEVHRIAVARHTPNTLKKIRVILQMLFAPIYSAISGAITVLMKNKYSRENLIDYESSMDLLPEIDRNMKWLEESCHCHYISSIVSAFYQALTMLFLHDGEVGVSAKMQRSMRVILSGIFGTVSGEVPKEMEEIMREIILSGKKEEFCTVQIFAGIEWLNGNIPEAGKALEEFLHKNSHRGNEELDLFTITWGMDPGIVIEMLQRILRTVNDEKELNIFQIAHHPSAEEIIDQLEVSHFWPMKYVLKRVISHALFRVVDKESTKNHLTRVLHEFRLAFRHLGWLMTREGLLVTPELIFFLTYGEVRLLIEQRDPKIVRKAIQRKRIFSEVREESFPEFTFGVPQPIGGMQRSIQGTGNEVRGTSANPGLVTGRAAVILSIQDAWQIASGDILITRSADIGWSPYFPILKGLVLELGGLLSHGTIIACEYGLPCIVSAADATRQFKHGDLVTLDAETGVVFRVE